MYRSWFLILSTDALTSVRTLLIVMLSPEESRFIGFAFAEDIRPVPRKSSNRSRWFVGSSVVNWVMFCRMISSIFSTYIFVYWFGLFLAPETVDHPQCVRTIICIFGVCPFDGMIFLNSLAGSESVLRSSVKELVDCWSVLTGIIIASQACHARWVAPEKNGDVSMMHRLVFVSFISLWTSSRKENNILSMIVDCWLPVMRCACTIAVAIWDGNIYNWLSEGR